MINNHPLCNSPASRSRSRASVAALTAIYALSFAGQSSAAIVFADTFDRANSSSLNASTAGKSGTLGALNWNERQTVSADGDVLIASNRMVINSGTNTNNSNVPYVDHNFIGYTSMTISLDFIAAATAGSQRDLGFSIGNSKATLDALISSAPFGLIRIGVDNATSVANSTPETGISIRGNGLTAVHLPRTLVSGDTISANFNFANMNAGTTINFEVFHEGVSIHTGTNTWGVTNQNYIGFYNTHRTATGDDNIIDNFVVEAIPEPGAALLGGLGLLALLRRRRD